MTASPNDPHIGLVVEGPGDLRALPLLLRALDQRAGRYCDCLGKPVPLNGRSNAVRPEGIEGYVATAAARVGALAVLVVLDADRENDPVTFTSDLVDRARTATHKPVDLILATPEFEQWLYASAESLSLDLKYRASTRGLSAIRDALKPQKYVKPVWQPKLTTRMDLDLALRRSTEVHALQTTFNRLHDLMPTEGLA